MSHPAPTGDAVDSPRRLTPMTPSPRALAAILALPTLTLPTSAQSAHTPGERPGLLPAVEACLAGMTLAFEVPGACAFEDASFVTAEGGCKDLSTGLVWSAWTRSIDPGLSGDWWWAVDYCENLVEGGYDDWTLPDDAQLRQVGLNGAGTHLDWGLIDNPQNYFQWSSRSQGQRAFLVAVASPDPNVIKALKESVGDGLCVRQGSVDGTPPAAPSGLLAAAAGSSAVNLAWTDNALDEAGYQVERTVDGLSWTTVALLPADAVTHTDTGLAPATTYGYRVLAYNDFGNSAYSNEAIATTDGGGDPVATGEVPVAGSVAGTFSDTWGSDDVYQVLTEDVSKGSPASRTSFAEHKWTLTVPAGATVTLHVEAYHDDTGEGDDFEFSWSDHDGGWTPALVVDKTFDDDVAQTFVLPGGVSGTLWLRAVDLDRTPGNGERTSLYVDRIHLTEE